MSTNESIESIVSRTNKICFKTNQKLIEVDKKLSDLREILKLIKEKTDKL